MTGGGGKVAGEERVTALRNFLAPAARRLPLKSCSRGFFNPSGRFLNTFPRAKSTQHR